jgi:hypothetical protein
MVELSGDFVTATHETCMTHCPDRLHYLVSMLTLILLPLFVTPRSLNLFLVFCMIHSTLIVICHKSMLNFLSSVAEFLFVLLWHKVLGLQCNGNTSTKAEFGKQASSVKYGTPMNSLSVKKSLSTKRKLTIKNKINY